jgi:hypothetical protein
MYPFKWNHPSTLKTNCPTHKPLLEGKKMLFSNIQLPCNWQEAKLKQDSVPVLTNSENV